MLSNNSYFTIELQLNLFNKDTERTDRYSLQLYMNFQLVFLGQNRLSVTEVSIQRGLTVSIVLECIFVLFIVALCTC